MCLCVWLCSTVVHNPAQNSSDKFPYPPDKETVIIAQMMSTGGEGDEECKIIFIDTGGRQAETRQLVI